MAREVLGEQCQRALRDTPGVGTEMKPRGRGAAPGFFHGGLAGPARLAAAL